MSDVVMFRIFICVLLLAIALLFGSFASFVYDAYVWAKALFVIGIGMALCAAIIAFGGAAGLYHDD